MSLACSWSARLPYNDDERRDVLSGDFGDFASFVTRMKDIAKVSRIVELREIATYAFVAWLRRRTWTCYWLTLVISTMVSDTAPLSHGLQADYAEGTGLTDGFPPNGVDGHEVRVQALSFALLSYTYDV